MQIELSNISKRFDSGWVIRNLDLTIHSGDCIAIKGHNGSGKSTLLSMIAGYLSPSKGKISYTHNQKVIGRDEVFKHLSLSTAYGELDEELYPMELFKHYSKFKSYPDYNSDSFLQKSGLWEDRNKQIKYFSSGMKQRLGLALAIATDSALLLLDEPTSFLDVSKKDWFLEFLQSHLKDRTIVIASNDESDFVLCNRSIELTSNG